MKFVNTAIRWLGRIILALIFAPVAALAVYLVFLMILSSGVMLWPCSCEIRGLNLRRFVESIRYDHVIRRMGEPISREYGRLYYEGITFSISNNAVAAIEITGEQHRLGGGRNHRLGVGSTRCEVSAASDARRANYDIWLDLVWRICCVVDFEYDENDIVTRIRIGHTI